MKIAIVCHEGPPVKSGGATLVEDLWREFTKSGIKTHIYLPKFKDHNPNNHSDFRTIPATRRSDRGITAWEMLKIIVIGTFKLRKMLIQDEITHVYSVFALPAGVITKIAVFNTKIKTTMIVDAIDLPTNTDSPLAKFPFAHLLVRRIILSTKDVRLIEGLEEDFLSLMNKSCKTVRVGIGESPKENSKHDHDFLEPRLLTVCRLVPRKNVALSIRTIFELKKMGYQPNLTIVGDGPNKNFLFALVAELKLEDSVTFAGFVEKDDLEKVYRANNLYLFTGYNEGISIALLEACRYGLPVVTTYNFIKTGEIRELMEPLTVESYSATDLAAKIHKIFTDENFRNDIELSMAKIASKYSWRLVIKDYLSDTFEKERIEDESL
jgi:glycosyltransferase involved in cell wall biosynthesis